MPELGFCKLLLAIIGAVLTGLTLFKLVICCLTIPKDGIADFILTLGTELVWIGDFVSEQVVDTEELDLSEFTGSVWSLIGS